MEQIRFNNYSEHHPELQDGEVWFANMTPQEANVFELDTKRVGKIAYDTKGNKVEGLVPIFMSQEEEYRKKFERE